ncbi:MAG: CinA family protein [Alphaproteobacteria bacterium]|nr:CinA family protein [Alphaproteobacteria bacterium]MBV9062793.1 CinA family protein [Alphaproteobacteria bacterium]
MTGGIEVTQVDAALVKRGARLFKLLDKQDLTLATAESCTGGIIASILSDAPGAGDRFHGGFVLYTKQHKIAFGIPKKTIDANGIVSEAVARAMAEGALKNSPADIAVAVTGVAGPEPDDEGNPVGLVCIAAARKGWDSIARTYLGPLPSRACGCTRVRRG